MLLFSLARLTGDVAFLAVNHLLQHCHGQSVYDVHQVEDDKETSGASLTIKEQRDGMIIEVKFSHSVLSA